MSSTTRIFAHAASSWTFRIRCSARCAVSARRCASSARRCAIREPARGSANTTRTFFASSAAPMLTSPGSYATASSPAHDGGDPDGAPRRRALDHRGSPPRAHAGQLLFRRHPRAALCPRRHRAREGARADRAADRRAGGARDRFGDRGRRRRGRAGDACGGARRNARLLRAAHTARDEGGAPPDPPADAPVRGQRSCRALLYERRLPRGSGCVHRAAEARVERAVTRFHEEQHFHGALVGLLLVSMIFVVVVTVVAVVLARPEDALLLAIAPVVVVIVASLISLSHLDVDVADDGVRIAFRYLWPTRRIRFEDIVGLQVRRYRP